VDPPAVVPASDPFPALVAYVTGPTAVGKSEIALRLAEAHGWAILSIDSRQIYRGLDVGTAKPSAAERERAPHLLLDLLDPGEACSAGRFRAFALEALESLRVSGRRALAVGGAGLYWEALTRGLHPLPASSPEVRARHERIVRQEGVEGLYRRLQAVDPETARRLKPRDRQRVGRALEVAELAGEPMSCILARPERGPEAAGSSHADGDGRRVPVVALTRSRPDLYRRIEERCRRMLEAGLIDELRRLLDAGVSPGAPGLRSVGYREFLPHLLEGAPLADCVERFLRESRRYAKRQETWIRHRLPDKVVLEIGQGEAPDRTAARLEEGIAGFRLDTPGALS
jgi:tRNA dimethylallyltransferase